MPKTKATALPRRNPGSRSGTRTRPRAGNSSGLIMADLREQITRGELRPHERLLPEKEMAAHYATTLYQVRAAVRGLTREGWLYAKRRSGVFVADREAAAGERAAAPDSGSQSAEEDSQPYLTLDMITRGRRELSVVFSSWNPDTRSRWEEICVRTMNADLPFVLRPVFPGTAGEYNRLCAGSDLFFTTVNWIMEEPLRRELVLPVPRDVFHALPLRPKCEDAVRHDRSLLGVPVFTTMLVGAMNTARLTLGEQRMILRCKDWPGLLRLLAELADRKGGAVPLNLNRSRTLNPGHYLAMAGDGRDPYGYEFDAGRSERHAYPRADQDALRALEPIREYLTARFESSPLPSAEACAEACLVYFDFTYVLPGFNRLECFRPWVFPLSRKGRYVESHGIVCVGAKTAHPELCWDAVRFLLSDFVQDGYAETMGEFPASTRVKNPYAAYPREWRKVLRALR